MSIYYSFVAVPAKNTEGLYEISEKTTEPHILIKTSGWHFLFKGQAVLPTDQVQYSAGSHDYFFIGELYNIAELRVLASIYSSDALTCTAPKLLHLLYHHLGRSAFSLVDGPFTFIKSSDKDLTLLNDSLGYLPVNIIFSNGPWITSELKMVAKSKAVAFNFLETKELINTQAQSDDFSPIKNAKKMKAGQETCIRLDGNNHFYVTSLNYCDLTLGNDQEVSAKEASKIVVSLVETSLQNCIQNESQVTIPLSGGIDSSFIAALTAQKVDTLNTYSIGSEENNEFSFSKIVSEHLNTNHQEFILSNEEIMQGIVESIYYNEIFDGLSAEIQSGLFNMYRLDKGVSSAMITGYGADLIFGGVLDTTCPRDSINQLLWDQIYRTRWTGEFSNFGALRYGVKIKHPFWNLKLISYCLNLDPNLKIAKGEVKLFIREHIHNQQLLPEVITWRKKIGIHEGSSKNKIFANLIRVDSANYQAKTQFSYDLYKQFLTGKLTPEEFNLADHLKLSM